MARHLEFLGALLGQDLDHILVLNLRVNSQKSDAGGDGSFHTAAMSVAILTDINNQTPPQARGGSLGMLHLHLPNPATPTYSP